jgi:hypothetical protein
MALQHHIFISYRRDDSHSASHLFDSIRRKFATFYDRQVGPGHIFTQEAQAALERATVLIAVIGRGWMSTANLERLQDPKDWVRRELEKGLNRENVLVIPVRVDDIDMPKENALPESLRALCGRQARHLRVDSWDHDIGVLEDEIRRHLKQAAAPPPTRLSWLFGVTAALLLGVIAGVAVDETTRQRIAAPPPPAPPAPIPADEISREALGVITYKRTMNCLLPLDHAQAGATITFYNTFIRGSADCEQRIKEALENGGKIRLLIIHPDAATTAMRAAEFPKYALVRYRRDIVESLQTFLRVRAAMEHQLGKNIDTALQIRIYSTLPNMPIDIVEQPDKKNVTIIQGYFLAYSNGSNELPAALLKRPGNQRDAYLFDSLRSYVETKWDDPLTARLNLAELGECTQGRETITPWLECLHRLIPVKAISGAEGMPDSQAADARSPTGAR